MKTFEVTLTLSIDAMHEESAENKLDSFLSALDLKKNDKMNLLELGELLPADGDAEEPPKKAAKKRPKLSLEDEDEWDDSWGDEDWDSLDEEWEEEGLRPAGHPVTRAPTAHVARRLIPGAERFSNDGEASLRRRRRSAAPPRATQM